MGIELEVEVPQRTVWTINKIGNITLKDFMIMSKINTDRINY